MNILSVYFKLMHCVKSVRIRIFSGLYLPAFGLNTDTFHAVMVYWNIVFSIRQVVTEPGKVNTLDTIRFEVFN